MITEFPLLVFTVLTGIAAGGYVGSALFPRKSKDDRAWLFPLISFILIVIGGLSAMAHLGRPMMVLNVLNNPTSSLTMEGASAGVLALIALVDFIIAMRTGTANRVVRIIGAIVGVACMCIVTMAYTTSYGNVVWISMPTWPLFVLGDLAVGSAFWLMFADEPNKALAAFIAVVGALFAIVLIWQATTFASFGAAGRRRVRGRRRDRRLHHLVDEALEDCRDGRVHPLRDRGRAVPLRFLHGQHYLANPHLPSQANGTFPWGASHSRFPRGARRLPADVGSTCPLT